MKGLALITQDGNLFLNCENLCFFTNSDQKLLSVSTPERWSQSEKVWKTEVKEVFFSQKLINAISALVEIDENYEEQVSETCTEYGKEYTLLQPNGFVERVIYITGRNWHGYDGAIGHESLSQTEIKRFVGGIEVLKGTSNSKKRVPSK